MKVVLNKSYGGFGLSDALVSALGLDPFDDEHNRLDPEVIAAVEADAEAASAGYYANLRVITIPDTATDWRIDNYDGLETITYVIDGKLHRK